VDLEKEIRDAQSKLAAAKNEEASLRSKAQKLVEEKRAAGVDLLGDKEVFDEIDAAFTHADAKRDEVAALQAKISKALGWAAEKVFDSGTEGSEARTIVARLAQTPQFKLLQSRVEQGGARAAVMDPVTISTRDELLQGLRLNATVDNTDGSGGGLIWSDRKSDLVPIPQRRVRLLDVITVGTTDSDTIEYVREDVVDDNVTGQPYGTSLTEAEYGWTKDTTTVKRRGHWIPATEGALMDAGQLQTLLDNRLAAGVQRDTEQQIWNGNGTGENFLGILAAARAAEQQSVPAGTETYSRLHNQIHRALTKIRLANLDGDYYPNAFVINPVDWEALVLERDANGNYVHGGGMNEPGTVWGIRPVVTNLAASGTSVVGDFTQAVLWVRSGVAVSASNQHSDFFLKGLVALKAEYRAAFAILQKSAFVRVNMSTS
jgi:HK97 family phage major capsid protein